MNYKRIVFWQINHSPHQSSWVRELSNEISTKGGEVVCVFQKKISPDRLALGWQPPDYGEAIIINTPSTEKVGELLSIEPLNSIHIFSSIMVNQEINRIFNEVKKTGSTIGLLSEGRDWRGWTGLLRRLNAFRFENAVKRYVNFVLAIGQNGITWYTKCGYNYNQIYPFCYTVENCSFPHDNKHKSKTFKIVALGQLILRKRFDLLVGALAKYKKKKWELKIIGDGDQRQVLEKLAVSLGIEKQIDFMGILQNEKARAELSTSDLLVLPSRWDGWGAVVNEALVSGVPVICSDFCGAADLIIPGFNGEVFNCNSQKSLQVKLEKQMGMGPLTNEKREDIRRWARCLDGKSVANYFFDIISYHDGLNERPHPPWSIVQ